MRVGVVCPYDLTAPGGVQQLTLELAAMLRRTGDEVILVGAGRDVDNDPGRMFVGRSLRVTVNRSIAPVTLAPGSWRRTRSALTEVDVVHIHEPLVPLVGWAALGVDRPVVATFHADPPRWATAMYRRAPGLGSRMRQRVLTAVSATAAAAIPGSWGDVRVIPNAIDVAAYRPPVDRVALRVCFLGRDEPRKGLDVLLEAWPLVRAAVPQAELKVMGASRSEQIPGVEYLGRVGGDEKKRVLASSMVYVAPNIGGESFGIVIAEAMAAGCAVVCSDLRAFRDVVGSVARIVRAGDRDSLAEAITSLLVEPGLAEEMGQRARQVVSRFDWAVVVDEYRQAYHDALT